MHGHKESYRFKFENFDLRVGLEPTAEWDAGRGP